MEDHFDHFDNLLDVSSIDHHQLSTSHDLSTSKDKFLPNDKERTR